MQARLRTTILLRLLLIASIAGPVCILGNLSLADLPASLRRRAERTDLNKRGRARACFQGLRYRLHPSLPVVLTSGYSHVLAQNGADGFDLLKPYSVEELSRVLQMAGRVRRQKV